MLPLHRQIHFCSTGMELWKSRNKITFRADNFETIKLNQFFCHKERVLFSWYFLHLLGDVDFYYISTISWVGKKRNRQQLSSYGTFSRAQLGDGLGSDSFVLTYKISENGRI